MINCKKCGKPTGPAFGLCAECIQNEDTRVRVQIAVYNILQAEFIAQSYQDADEMLAAYWRRRYNRGLEMGGACIAHVDRPRQWNVSVGSVIPEVK